MSTVHDPILQIHDLSVGFSLRDRYVSALNGVDLSIPRGAAVGIVGESGCGKSVTAYTTLRLLPHTARITSGSIRYWSESGAASVDLLSLNPNSPRIRSIRGGEIAMVFQEPMTAMSPVHRIGDQITDVIRIHEDVSPAEARDRAIDLLQRVGVKDAQDRIDDYTFQFSGGMRQRAMIAMALAARPRVLIADEPTTALDVTIQAQVLRLLVEIQRREQLSLVLITHDLGVVAQTVDYVCVMYLGRVVESGPVSAVFDEPKHPYTKGLLRSIPRNLKHKTKLSTIPGFVPSTSPSGCPFHTRCESKVGSVCERMWPGQADFGSNHIANCHLYADEEHSYESH